MAGGASGVEVMVSMITEKTDRRIRCLLLCLVMPALVVLGSLHCFADVHPEHDERAPALTGFEFQPRLGEYHYEITWGRSRVATATISIELEGDHYVLRADQQTTKFIDRIYRVRYRGETRIHTENLSPTESVIEEQIKSRKNVQSAKYDDQTNAVNVVERQSETDASDVEIKTYQLQSDTSIVDVFSAIFLARNFDWDIGERHEFMVFVGDKQYHVTMDCTGKSTFDLDGLEIPVWVIQPGIRKTTKEEPYRVHEKTRIFIAADESKDIVKISSQPGIGTVKLRLVKFLEK